MVRKFRFFFNFLFLMFWGGVVVVVGVCVRVVRKFKMKLIVYKGKTTLHLDN